MEKIREVRRLRCDRSGSVHEIAEACNVSTFTVHKYLYRSEAAGPVWPVPEPLSDVELERLLFLHILAKGVLARTVNYFFRSLSRTD